MQVNTKDDGGLVGEGRNKLKIAVRNTWRRDIIYLKEFKHLPVTNGKAERNSFIFID